MQKILFFLFATFYYTAFATTYNSNVDSLAGGFSGVVANGNPFIVGDTLNVNCFNVHSFGQISSLTCSTALMTNGYACTNTITNTTVTSNTACDTASVTFTTAGTLFFKCFIPGHCQTNPQTLLGSFVVAYPALSSISPQTGKVSGGTTVTINVNFPPNATANNQCMFGTSVPLTATISGSQFTCTAPAGSSIESVTLLVGGSAVNGSVNYTYQDITGLSISPVNGSTNGGTTVTVTSTTNSFINGINQCKFGTNAIINATFVNTGMITCQTPGLAAQNTTVMVTNNGQDFYNAGNFTFIGVVSSHHSSTHSSTKHSSTKHSSTKHSSTKHSSTKHSSTKHSSTAHSSSTHTSGLSKIEVGYLYLFFLIVIMALNM